MKVTFCPSREEHIEFLLERQKQRQSKATNYILWLFLIFNIWIVPGILIYWERVWTGLAAFALNLVLVLFVWSVQQKGSVRKHFENAWPELEKFDCEIEIDELGLSCEHAGNKSFYPWRNIEAIGSMLGQIFFDAGPATVLLSKRAFVDKQAEMDFFEQAQKYQRATQAEC